MWSSKITEDKTVQRYIGSWIAAVIFLGPGTACSTMQAQAPSAQEAPPAPATTVVTRGKIIPEWDIIKLSVSNAEDSRVNKMLVKEGDRVQANQVIAILQGADQRLADLKAAQANVKLLRAQLTKAQQGETKPGAIAAQRAAVARLKAQLPAEVKQKQAAIAGAEAALHEATLTYQRRQILSREGAIGQADLDAAQKELETAQATLVANKADLTQTDTTLKAQIAEGQAKLAELQQVLPSDIAIAQAELEKALIEVEQKKADLEDARVRAPVAGQILRINTKVGEQVNTQLGIVDLGRTERMFVRAEVYETDLTKIRKQQRATVVSEYGGFQGKVHGTVEAVGLQIGQRTLSEGAANPTTDDNARVVDVLIRIDPKDNPKVARLTNMQVRVTIDLTPSKT